jgi:hypothetical protein
VLIDRYRQGLADLTGEDRNEITYVWQQAGRATSALDEFVSHRLVELAAADPPTVVADLQALPNVELDRLARHLRTVVAVQSGAGLPYTQSLASLLQHERGRRMRDLIT